MMNLWGSRVSQEPVHAVLQMPSIWLTHSEPMRAAIEATVMIARFPELLVAARGDGHTVIVLPGFATTDLMTQALRNYLSWLGYDSEPRRLGFNIGYHKLGENQANLRGRLAQIARHSGEKVSLIGWSLGGKTVCENLGVC